MSALGATRLGAPARSRRAARRATTTRASIRVADWSREVPAVNLSRRDAVLSAAALVSLAAPQRAVAEPVKASFYDYTVERNGTPFSLDAFRGNVTVVMNVASE
jgi:glutathione peroxidase